MTISLRARLSLCSIAQVVENRVWWSAPDVHSAMSGTGWAFSNRKVAFVLRTERLRHP